MTEKTGYTKLLAELNGYDIRRWVIAEGMGFQARSKWWTQGARGLPHNGIDLRLYEDSAGRQVELDARTLVPAIADGTVLCVIADFLGRTIFVEHEARDGSVLISAYGHVLPDAHCIAGHAVQVGQAIATLAATPDMPVPSHLHLSLLSLPAERDRSALTWQWLDADATFLDPALWF